MDQVHLARSSCRAAVTAVGGQLHDVRIDAQPAFECHWAKIVVDVLDISLADL